MNKQIQRSWATPWFCPLRGTFDWLDFRLRGNDKNVICMSLLAPLLDSTRREEIT